MNKKKLLACLSLPLNIFTAEKIMQTISPLNIALNAIQNRSNTTPGAVNLTNCINDTIAGGTLLHHAIMQGKIDWVENLLRQKADVNKLSTSPRLSPLQMAASLNGINSSSNLVNQDYFNRLYITNLLIENGANPRNPDISEFLPIFQTHNPQIRYTSALINMRMGAIDKCNEFLADVTKAKLSSAEIRALPLYQIYADNNPQLKAYLDKLDQQEIKTQGRKRTKTELPITKPFKIQRTEMLIKNEQQD
jgi:ankyrin repeat protein